MTTYKMANTEAKESVKRMCDKYHPDLESFGVTFDVLVAFGPVDANGDVTSPAIKVRGHACAAKVKILPLKDRTAGRSDVEIVLDGDHFDEWSDDELDAIVDHELTHLEVVVDEKGGIVRDDRGRPKLKMRHHDKEFGWFDSVARRHKACAAEVNQASPLIMDETNRQLYFPFVKSLSFHRTARDAG